MTSRWNWRKIIWWTQQEAVNKETKSAYIKKTQFSKWILTLVNDNSNHIVSKAAAKFATGLDPFVSHKNVHIKDGYTNNYI